MKTLIGIIAVLAIGLATAGCDDRRIKHAVKHATHGKHSQQDRHNNGRSPGRLPGDNHRQAPNCAADGPGCQQMRR